MLSAKHRLRRRTDFVRTVRGGRRAHRPAVVGHLLVDSGTALAVVGVGDLAAARAPEPVQVGFVVSRAVGGAVQRNRVRRRLRHLMRDRLSTLPAGASLVVRAQPVAAQLPTAALARDLDGVLGRLARPQPMRGTGQ